MAFVLTSPATGIVAGLLYIARLAQHTGFRQRAAITFGCLTLAIPWQIHCYRALGHVVPLMYESRSDSVRDSGFLHWAKTWMRRPSEFNVVFDHDLMRVPPDAFQDAAERLRVMNLKQSVDAGAITATEYQQAFSVLGDERIAADKLRMQIAPGMARAFNLWWEVPECMPVQWTYVGRIGPATFVTDRDALGSRRALLRLTKGLYSSVMYFVYLLSATIFGVALIRSLLSRKIIPTAIALGVVGYTLASATTGYCESRRNVVFYPLIVCAAAVAGNANREMVGGSCTEVDFQ